MKEWIDSTEDKNLKGDICIFKPIRRKNVLLEVAQSFTFLIYELQNFIIFKFFSPYGLCKETPQET